MGETLYLSESSSTRAGETGRGSDGGSLLVIEAVDSFEFGCSLGLEWKSVALRYQPDLAE
jgi:hypothetical protein